jgi:hypothetical protein
VVGGWGWDCEGGVDGGLVCCVVVLRVRRSKTGKFEWGEEDVKIVPEGVGFH